VYPEGQSDLPAERPVGGFERSSTPKTFRVVIVEPHPAVRVVLEYLLAREGYTVETREEASCAAPGPTLLLIAAEDGSGLHVFESGNAAETLAQLPRGDRASPGALSGVTGIHAFVPKPFGTGDVLRVVRAVSGFDGRGRVRSQTERGRSRLAWEDGETGKAGQKAVCWWTSTSSPGRRGRRRTGG
jgi:hypothetical protein